VCSSGALALFNSCDHKYGVTLPLIKAAFERRDKAFHIAERALLH
jgi:hypothetical protein